MLLELTGEPRAGSESISPHDHGAHDLATLIVGGGDDSGFLLGDRRRGVLCPTVVVDDVDGHDGDVVVAAMRPGLVDEVLRRRPGERDLLL